jgi:hypothetical protein
MLNPSRFKYRDHSSVLPRCGDVMGEEDGLKVADQEEYRSLCEMLQSPVRYTVRARSLADRDTPDGFLNLLRFG